MTGKEISISKVYPNPVKGNVFVKISLANNTRLRVEIMNSVGQLVNAYNEKPIRSIKHTVSEVCRGFIRKLPVSI